jgi:hypothetical protein
MKHHFLQVSLVKLNPIARLSPVGLAWCLGGAITFAAPGLAAPYGIPIPPGPFIVPVPCFNYYACYEIAPPHVVPGKEASVGNVRANEYDRDQFFNYSTGQNLMFDGVNILPQSGLRNTFFPVGIQVDALANKNDMYFEELVSDRVSLLFSVENDKFGQSIFAKQPKPLVDIPFSDAVLWSRSEGVFGDKIHGYGPLVVGGDTSKVIDPQPVYPITKTNNLVDLDALDVWGPEGGFVDQHEFSNANCFSPVGDTLYGQSASIFCDEGDIGLIPLISQLDIARAIGIPDPLAPLIDVDALMASNRRTNFLFSVRPLNRYDYDGGLSLDGAEVWVLYTYGGLYAHPLNHGGHRWDTAFNLRQYLIDQGFGDMGIPGQPGDVNLDALEAVPGPLPILGVGAAFGWSRKLRAKIRMSRQTH